MLPFSTPGGSLPVASNTVNKHHGIRLLTVQARRDRVTYSDEESYKFIISEVQFRSDIKLQTYYLLTVTRGVQEPILSRNSSRPSMITMMA